ncbi:MAG: hypothetical protein ACE5IO_07110 [Thermoplasmata archaeon]
MTTTMVLKELVYDFLHRSKGIDPFPVQVAPPSHRSIVNSFEALWGVVEYYNGRAHLYYGIYPEELKWLRTVDLIWFEIDYNDHVKEKLKIAVHNIDSFLEAESIAYRRVFSANRGFHYYILHRPVALTNPKYCIDQWLLRLPEIPKTIRFVRQADGTAKPYPASGYDKKSSNIEQMVRVPFSEHPKTGLMAVEYYGKPRFMAEPEIRAWELNSKIHHELKRFDKEVPKYKPYDKEIKASIKHWPQCIYDAIDIMATPDAISHDHSIHLTAFLFRVGMSEEDIVEFYRRNRPDFKEGICRYQVNDIITRNGGMMPFKCVNARRIGLCPEEEDRFKWCPYYPNVMHILRSISEEQAFLKKHERKL